MQENTVSRTGADIYFVSNIKNGQNIFLINGYSRSSSDFKAMMKFLDERGLGTVTCDNRGAGRSLARLPFTIDDMVTDILAIMDQLEMRRMDFLGISMGGLILQKLLEMAPERVGRVIFISTTNNPLSIDSSNHQWPDNEDGIFAKMTAYFSEEFVAKNKLLIKAMAKNIFNSMQDGDFAVQSGLQSDAIRQLQLSTMADPLSKHALIIHGDQDRVIPLANGLNLAKRFDDAQLLIYPGAGHLLIAECGKKMYGDIADFMDRTQNEL